MKTIKTTLFILLLVPLFNSTFADAANNSKDNTTDDTKSKAKKKDLKKESKAAATGEDKFVPITQIGLGVVAYSGTSNGNNYSSVGGSLSAAFGVSPSIKIGLQLPLLQYAQETGKFAAIGDMNIGFKETLYNGVKNGTGSKFAWGATFGFPTGSAVAQNTSNDYTITPNIGYLYVLDKMGNTNMGFSFQFQLNYQVSLYDGNGLIYDSTTGTYSNRSENIGTIDSQIIDSEYQFNFFLWKGGSISITPHLGYTITNTNGGNPLSVELGFALKQMINDRFGIRLGGKYSFVGNPLKRYSVGIGMIYLLS